MPPLTRGFPGAVALAIALLLAACVTGAAPAPAPMPVATGTPTPVPWPAGAAFTQLAVGQDHVCGLTEEGTALCWGRNDGGQLDVPGGMRFRQLAAGSQFSCGLRLDGTVACWGRVEADWFGDEPGIQLQISAWESHLCGLDAQGAVACWGSPSRPPPDEGRYTAIGAGRGYGCGLTPAGDLDCWGRNNYGQGQPRTGPFTTLAVGRDHLCALRPDGTALCQGHNAFGQADPPDAVFTGIVAGGLHSCGITNAGALACWGTRETPPTGPFTALFSGEGGTCALRPDGRAICREMHGGLPSMNVEPAFGSRPFDQPVELFPWPGGGLAVAERRGAIAVYVPGASPRLVLDLSDRTSTGLEQGLLGVALDPEFDAFPYLYLWHTAFDADPAPATARLSRFTIVNGRADAESELVLLKLPHQLIRHHGGAPRFGPDGMLYLGIGDHGQQDSAQDLGNLPGAIIRIDVRGATAAQPYRIPDDNPLVATPDARPEIWAWGVRNPWRMSFDAEGKLWVADVGLARQEEVSLAAPGANLGWPLFQGTRCQAGERACAALAATSPVATYGHELGCAIIGGVHIPPAGAYLFGDYCNGRIWALEADGEGGWAMREIASAGRPVLSFGTGADGEVYVLTEDGPILRLTLPP